MKNLQEDATNILHIYIMYYMMTSTNQDGTHPSRSGSDKQPEVKYHPRPSLITWISLLAYKQANQVPCSVACMTLLPTNANRSSTTHIVTPLSQAPSTTEAS